MASTSDFKNGLIINHKNGLWKIIDFLHVKPGKGSAFVRTKLKNLKTSQVVEETFRSGHKVEIVRIDAIDYNYLDVMKIKILKGRNLKGEIASDTVKNVLINDLKEYLQEGDIIYLKGSRGMKMEDIISGLKIL